MTSTTMENSGDVSHIISYEYVETFFRRADEAYQMSCELFRVVQQDGLGPYKPAVLRTLETVSTLIETGRKMHAADYTLQHLYQAQKQLGELFHEGRM